MGRRREITMRSRGHGSGTPKSVAGHAFAPDLVDAPTRGQTGAIHRIERSTLHQVRHKRGRTCILERSGQQHRHRQVEAEVDLASECARQWTLPPPCHRRRRLYPQE